VLAELSRRFPLGLKLTALRRHAVDLLRLSSGRVSPFFPG